MRWVDFDVHGLIGIRFVSPSPRAEGAVKRQLGALQSPLVREPDITFRFVERLPATRQQLLGPDQYGFTADAFWILSGSRGGAKVQIPFERLGTPCEIICEKGVDEAPLLIELVRLLAVSKDCAPLHGSAFVYKGNSILVSSWAKGGKTTALLGFLSLGAEFIADDCVLLSGDGQTMYGIPTPIEVSDRHMASMPSLRGKVNTSERLRITGLAGLRTIRNSRTPLTGRTSLAARAWQKSVLALEQHCSVLVPPQKAFGDKLKFRAPAPSKIFILMSHEHSRIEVEPSSLSEVVSRLVAASLREQKALTEHYLAFKFAFPLKSNPLIERARERQRDILLRALRRKSAYIVRHPYPVHFPDLYEALRPYCEQTPSNFTDTAPRLVARRDAQPAIRPPL